MPRYGGVHGKGYVLMGGMRGYMPEYTAWFSSKKAAVNSAIEEVNVSLDNPDLRVPVEKIYRLGREIRSALRKRLYVDLPSKIFGWEHLEIVDSEEGPDSEDLM